MKRSSKRWLDLGVLLVYIVISLAMSYPLPMHINTHVPGRQMDARVFQWNNWWIQQALYNGQSPYYTDYLYHPSGVSLAGHNFNWISSLIAIPLDWAFGPTVAYNLTFLLTLFMSGFGMYLLVHDLTQRRDAAFIAGLVFAFSPYHLSGNWDGQMNLANIQWIPLFVLFLLRTMDSKRIRDAVLAGILMALASLDCWFFMVFLGMWGILFLVYSLLWEREKWTWRLVALLASAAAVFAILTLPLLWPVIAGQGQTPLTGLGQDTAQDALNYYADHKSTDLLAFVVPSSDHPLLERYTKSAYDRFSHWRPAFLGYSILALALYAALRMRRKAILWSLSGLLFASLALGTVLRVQGVEYPSIPLPFKVLTTLIPAFKLIRQASRFNVMTTFSLAVLVGLGCADLLARLQQCFTDRHLTWLYRGTPLLFSALILFEYLAIPCPLLPAQVSPFYHALAKQKEEFAIVELPLGLLFAGRSLYPQTIHHKPLVNGYVARAAYDADAFVYATPLLKALRLRIDPDPTLHDLASEMNVLALNNIRYVVIHKTAMPPAPVVEKEVMASWLATFGPNPYYEDDEILVYSIPPSPNHDASPVLRFSDQLGLLDVQTRRTRILGHQFLTVDLAWKALSTLDRTYTCRLSLHNGTQVVAQTADWIISPHYPTSRWKKEVVVAERYAIPLDPSLPAGDYWLSIAVKEATSEQMLDGQDHAIRIDADPSLFSPILDDIQHPVDATFGEKMWLIGYDQQQKEDRLLLDMYWQALEKMQTSYKIFVHLVRTDDGTIVAQKDTMPRGWSYPTSFWSRQEIFVDHIELDVTRVEPGDYQLAIGVYKPEIGRLTVVDKKEQVVPDNRLILNDTVTVQR